MTVRSDPAGLALSFSAARQSTITENHQLLKGAVFRRLRGFCAEFFLRMVLAVPCCLASVCFAAFADDFAPVRELTSWHTDRTSIDLEIVGSTSMSPDMHALEPERRLRFRLERAFVTSLIAKAAPGFELVRLGFDSDSGLPLSLFVAELEGGRFKDKSPGLPEVSRPELTRRSLQLLIQSDVSSQSIQKTSAAIEKCAGSKRADGLIQYEIQGRAGCSRSAYPNGSRYLVQSDSGIFFLIDCRDAKAVGLGCAMKIPFEGFGVEVSFNHQRLPAWKDVVRRAEIFLKSKQYR